MSFETKKLTNYDKSCKLNISIFHNNNKFYKILGQNILVIKIHYYFASSVFHVTNLASKTLN